METAKATSLKMATMMEQESKTNTLDFDNGAADGVTRIRDGDVNGNTFKDGSNNGA